MTHEPNEVSNMDILDTMERYGGGFVSALAAAWKKADSFNFQRLQETFYTYWMQYKDMTIHLESCKSDVAKQ